MSSEGTERRPWKEPFREDRSGGHICPVPIDLVTRSDLRAENSRLYDWNSLYSDSQVFSGSPGRPDQKLEQLTVRRFGHHGMGS
jgi:hypothetical protein